MHALKRGFVVASLGLGMSVPLLSQQSSVPLQVMVTDIHARGAVVPRARIEVTDHQTGASKETVTGEDGRASVLVNPGRHRIVVTADGYSPLFVNDFCVALGKPAVFDPGLGRAERARGGPRPLPPIGPPPMIVPPSIPSQAVLSALEVRDALAFGRGSPKLSGYELIAPQGGDRSTGVRLLTPFLRIATMAQVADATRKPFEEADIPRAFLEHFAWIVAGSKGYEEYTDEGRKRYFVPPRQVTMQRKEGRAPVPAAWTLKLNSECDVAPLESVLGRQLPLPGLVVGFPLDALSPGNSIVITYSGTADPNGPGISLVIGPSSRRVKIGEDEIRRWK